MKRIFISIVKFYRKNISPAKKPCCRFYPTCSEYALIAVEKYGAVKGAAKTAKRILKCNPLFKGGADFP